MVFGYARVSKEDQCLEMQIDSLNKYGVDEIFQDKASGVIQDRENLNILLTKLRKGDTLVIYKLDRLGRTSKQLLSLSEEFKKQGINFVSLQENFDTSTPIGTFCFGMFSLIAQMERDVIAQRTKEGLKAARKRGRVGGRKPVDQESINTALKMYNSNDFTINEITRATNISKTTLYKYRVGGR